MKLATLALNISERLDKIEKSFLQADKTNIDDNGVEEDEDELRILPIQTLEEFQNLEKILEQKAIADKLVSTAQNIYEI